MGSEEENRGKSKFMIALPLLLLLVSIPLSLTLWLGNMAFSAFWESESEPISPTRWLFSVITPILFAAYGLKKKSLSVSGAVLGLVVGFVLTLSSYLFLICLIVFFITSSRATKFRSNQKRKLEEDFKEGGQRNWVQVLCNSGMALQLALLYILDSGCGERPVDFSSDYRASWLALGVLGSLSCCNGDTWASELGAVVGGGQPRLITNGRPVPRGTNGGVSPQGLLFSLLGGLVVGVGYYVGLLYLVDTTSLVRSPPQWPVILWAAFAGLFGSVVDSLLGATVQFSGLDKSRGCVVECPGPGVKHISGFGLLDNHSVNLVSSIISGLVTPMLANLLWPH
ncbi:transmembrane protein 19-like [Macrosteles quadrilineatus]|uniref:transmembrane protein 19-like n=1 Tax=Macrosteles quadrilineatus TaxID=74068 RepID=UPI0023E110F8|nr:transmembrane protein 19-like [Macrosteles quadrilineatus]XP_054288924.1 transmembrane protein 19-like [Macrosteles quadrilineatus]XP_054288925.1 transmembrane protein 19-like [Macrosteles quadrilineatus]